MPKEEITDTTQTVVETDSTTDNTAELDAAKAVQSKLTEVLEKHGYEDIDEFEADYESSSELRKTVGKRDINKLIGAQDELEKIHEYWAEMKAKKQMETESEDETINRLARENQNLKLTKKQEAQIIEDQREAKQMIKNYNTEVTSFIDKEEIPKSQRQFLKEYLGVDNKFNDIDISDKNAIKRNAKQGVDTFKKLQKQIIEDYRSGKLAIPDITPVEDNVVATDETKPKNLKEAKKLLLERMTRKAS